MVEQQERTLDEKSVHRDPIIQFQQWFDEASAAQPIHPNAMSLATASTSGKPSVRIVLLKQVDARGFVFFTNYGSRKSRELESNPSVELCFHWPAFERQVRIEGIPEKVSPAESDEYFKTRPRGSQLSTHASSQSETVANREELDAKMALLEKQFEGKEIPRPAHWGGYRVKPVKIEFWQGRQARLHDRILYTKSKDGGWRIERLAP